MSFHDGGYFYGNEVEAREFVLECYFEEIEMDTFERIIQWLHRDREGKLIFDDRPFVYYIARVSKVVEGKVYSSSHLHKWGNETLYSGTFTVTFKAYDPFGRMTCVSYPDFDKDGVIDHSGIMREDEMPPAIQPQTGDYLVYNPGTETTDTFISIAGTAPNGLMIRNATTGDVCEIVSLPSSLVLTIDSETGWVSSTADPDGSAFEYHDLGYIRLAPCTPYEREVVASYVSGLNMITFPMYETTEENVGQYIRLDGEWLRIISVSGKTAIVNKFLKKTSVENTMITTMNEISVEGEGAELTLLKMEYEPRIR